MATTNDEQQQMEPAQPTAEDVRESGHPGGCAGRIDEVGLSGVQPVSMPHTPRPDAVIRGMAEWGQGEPGAAGYQNHGDSELLVMPLNVETPSPPVEETQPETEVARRAEPKRPAGALPSGLLRHWRQPKGR
jgi:hypothetical protein